jgi:16S rRNA (guanine527-N7)-methyltransferase
VPADSAAVGLVPVFVSAASSSVSADSLPLPSPVISVPSPISAASFSVVDPVTSTDSALVSADSSSESGEPSVHDREVDLGLVGSGDGDGPALLLSRRDGPALIRSGERGPADQAAVGTEPVGTEPVGTEPVGTEPVGTEPAGEEPVGAEPPAEFAAAAASVFGDRLGLAREFARLLVTDGVIRGLIGPREAPRIWERHLINCAVMSEIIPIGASVIDVGSGAGLPGIVLAVARPDLSITLVEPLARRTAFLSEAVAALGLEATVTVVRGRAEDVVDGPPAGADVVTARAVASLDRLAGWCLPLAHVGGRLLALKGASAADEVAEHRRALAKLGGAEPIIRTCGNGLIDPPTTVVEIVKQRDVVPARSKSSTRAAGSGRNAGGRDAGQRRTRRG